MQSIKQSDNPRILQGAINQQMWRQKGDSEYQIADVAPSRKAINQTVT